MKTSLTACLLTASISAAAISAPVQAATTLRLAHFFPAASGVNQDLFEAWVKAVEDESEGELQVQLFPSGTLAKADAIYEAAENGIADIGITVQGYTAGRFPLTQIVELPGVSSSASQGACIVQTLYDQGHLDDEYASTRPLFLFSTGPGYIHTMDTLVETPSDLNGLRIRRPTAVVGDILESMGASPVGMPAPDVYTSMQRGVVDGVTLPWEGMKVFRLNELAEYHTQVPFYSMMFIATMSQRTYDSLSPEQQRVIDDNTGMAWAKKAGEVFDGLDKAGKQDAVDANHTIHVIDNPMDNPDWQQPLQQAIDNYLSELEAQGIDQARDVYEAALQARQSCPSS